ncbi:peptidylprolyl isomerase [bacterium]|nr:peptidylprolyl isomerase [bacterium]
MQFKTSRGDIVLELFENEAPNTVANFISLVEKEFYNGLKFHRVLPNFMAQGGCPLSKTDPARAGSGGPGYNIACEAYRKDARRHFSGSLSMAHAGKDTGGSQFFITHLPTPFLDKEVQPSSVHTVFGRVVEGLNVARELQKDDTIESATVIRKRNHEYVPETGPER